MHLIRREAVGDVVDADAGVLGVLRLGELLDQLLERLHGVARRLLVAFRDVLARDAAEQPQVVVEVDQALHVQRVVQRRAGRVELDEAVQHRHGLHAFTALVVGPGQVQLRLLAQRRAGGAAFDAFQRLDRPVVRAGEHVLLGLCVQFLQVGLGIRVLLGGRRTGRQSQHGGSRGGHRGAAPRGAPGPGQLDRFRGPAAQHPSLDHGPQGARDGGPHLKLERRLYGSGRPRPGARGQALPAR